MDTSIFRGSLAAVMTPCDAAGTPDFDVLVRTSQRLVATGMRGVVYCGSMGEWPLLTDEQRQEGVQRLVEAGVPVVVGTGAQSPATAVAHAAHARDVGAHGLMVIPRVLSRGTSTRAQRDHLARVLAAAPDLPAVVYNSPYYGYETGPELFFDLRRDHANLVGFKEFGGAAALTRAAEHITHADDELLLLVGVDTQVVHGFLRCGAAGAITGVGNCLPTEVLHLVELCRLGAAGDAEATRLAHELDDALHVLATFDEGPDLVLYYKLLATLLGDDAYAHPVHPGDELSPSQRRYAEAQLHRFQAWWRTWPGTTYGAEASTNGA
ncbi:MAG: dihydrodipicolinate synthase family protein [Trueperaceae bacterium]